MQLPQRMLGLLVQMAQDEVGCALADHHAGGVRVATWRPRHDGGVRPDAL